MIVSQRTMEILEGMAGLTDEDNPSLVEVLRMVRNYCLFEDGVEVRDVLANAMYKDITHWQELRTQLKVR